jgi:VanZ family protein
LKKRPALLALGWAWAAAIVWASLTPSPPEVDFEASDKLGHLFSYGLLMLWFAVLFTATKPRAVHAAAFIAMGVALEFAQAGLGYREFELLDMASNAAGVLAGWAAGAAAARFAPTILPR